MGSAVRCRSGGDTAIVGASNKAAGVDSPFQGAAYVFVRNGTVWSQQQKLTAGDGAANDYFGSSVSVRGDTAVIGADGARARGRDRNRRDVNLHRPGGMVV